MSNLSKLKSESHNLTNILLMYFFFVFRSSTGLGKMPPGKITPGKLSLGKLPPGKLPPPENCP